MHESIKAREVENRIREMARQSGLKKINKAVIRIGRGDPESRSLMEHLINEHIKITEVSIIEDDIVLRCGNCGRVIGQETLSARCPECGSARIDILSGTGIEVLSLE